jgi:hypothetical protein
MGTCCDRYGQYFTVRATSSHAARLKRLDVINLRDGRLLAGRSSAFWRMRFCADSAEHGAATHFPTVIVSSDQLNERDIHHY